MTSIAPHHRQLDSSVHPCLGQRVAMECQEIEEDCCHQTTQTSSLRKDVIVGGAVTCVAIPPIGDCCWIARGPWIDVEPIVRDTRTSTSRKRHRYLAFPDGGTVHGIRDGYSPAATTKSTPEEAQIVAVFGGRQICLLLQQQIDHKSEEDPFTRIHLLHQKKRQMYLTLSDWIWDAKVIRSSPGSEDYSMKVLLAVALANNGCEIWGFTRIQSCEMKTEDCITLDAVRCKKIVGESRCITYAMSLFGWRQPADDLIVASGTVSNQILVWTVLTTGETSEAWNEADGTKAVMSRDESHTLAGHEGVIHSVTFNSKGDALISTSDDRTIRLWNQLGKEWHLKWTAWGHTARVWSGVFASCGVVSSGEDGTVRLWSLETGSQLAECRNYNCQSQWCLDVCGDLIVVGSNDGSAKVYDLSSRVVNDFNRYTGPGTRNGTFLIPDDIDRSVVVSKKKKKNMHRLAPQIVCGFQFYRKHSVQESVKLLVATRGGTMASFCTQGCVWTMCPKPWQGESPIAISPKEGSCIAIHRSGDLLAIGTTRGLIVLVQSFDSTDAKRLLLDGQKHKSIQSLLWLDDLTLLSFHIKGIVTCWRVSYANTVSGSLTHVFDTTTGALPLSCAYDQEGGHFFIGDSRGNVAVFAVSLGESKVESCTAVEVISRLHGKQHVTGLAFSESRKLISVGNDGFINACGVTLDGSIQRGIHTPAGNISGLSSLWLVRGEGQDERIVAAGYVSSTFVAIDATTGHELFRVDTGGRQRSHDCWVNVDSSSSASYGLGVCVCRNDGRNEIILQIRGTLKGPPPENARVERSFGVSLHGEPIFDATFFETGPCKPRLALLTGSEDCAARVSLYMDSTLVRSDLLTPQESGVRAVATSRHKSRSSTLLVVGGGKLNVQFFILKHDQNVWQLSFRGRGRFPFQTAIEHRVNAVAAVPLDNNDNGKMCHLVATGDSNGSLSIFLVTESHVHHGSSLRGHVLARLLRPIFSLEILKSAGRCIVIVGTSGGEVLIWGLPCRGESFPFDSFPLAPLGKYSAHQMGTNCISAAVIGERGGCKCTSLLVCSGGDDQAITVSELEFCAAPDDPHIMVLEIVEVVTTWEASLSAVKGVHFIGSDRLLSVGYSQRLCLWQWQKGRVLELLDVKQVDVGDVNCLAAYVGSHATPHDGVAAVLGEGVEMFSLGRTGFHE